MSKLLVCIRIESTVSTALPTIGGVQRAEYGWRLGSADSGNTENRNDDINFQKVLLPKLPKVVSPTTAGELI
jgi:hypothetical protein